MALGELGKANVALRLIQDGKVYECVVKDKITITREKNAASKLTATILRDHVCPECGNALAFTLDHDHNQFYGYIITTHKSNEWCEVEAYDQLYYMNRNKMRFSYENATATEVCLRICQDRQYGLLDPPQLVDTQYRIPSRIEENVSDLTIITTALDLTFQNTGFRYYIYDDFGSVTLHHDGQLAADCNLILTRAYMEDYSYDETLDDMWTTSRVEQKLTGDNDGAITTTTARDDHLVEKYGFLEAFETAEEGENPETIAWKLLENNVPPHTTMSLSGVQGDMTVRGGTPILIDFFTGERREFIRGWYCVESVTHTIEQGYHTMDLEVSMLVNLNEWGNTDPNYYSYPFDRI